MAKLTYEVSIVNNIWDKNENTPKFKSLNGDIDCDVLIIGGGIAGILCAYKLQQHNINYALLEGDRILSGNTGNTTAKITVGHGLIYHKLIETYGTTFAIKYYYANKYAIEKYKELSKKYPCDFEENDLYVYSTDNHSKLYDEYQALNSMGIDAELCSADELPFETIGAIRHKKQGQFNPHKLLTSIAQELNIYEHSFVYKVDDHNAYCKSGTVHFKRVVFATHFPIVNKRDLYFLKLYQHRSYVITLKDAKQFENMYVDEKDSGYSFRPYGDRLIIAGGGGHTGKNKGGYCEVKNFVEKYYPDAQIEYEFAAQDCMTLDGVPYIGRHSIYKDNFYVATGFNTWGMTSAMIASDLLCDMLMSKNNPLEEIFTPRRSMLHMQLLKNAGNAVVNLLTPTAPRCTHMGCALKWNRQEQVWECPCHGSRYTKDGKLIENPALKNKQHM